MSRAPHQRRGAPGSVPVAPASADPAITAPAQPSTEALPSDQLSSVQEPISPAAAPVDPAPVGETAPLPAPPPPPPPAVPADGADAKPALEHVDGTVALPSDQFTPLLPVRSAGDDFAGEDEDAPFAAAGLGEQQPGATHDAGEALPPVAIWVGQRRDVIDLLRRDLDAAGFGVVMLSSDTVDLLRQALDLPSLRGEDEPVSVADDGEERRSFEVVSDVDHDKRSFAPGERVSVTRAQHERLRRGGSIAPGSLWYRGDPD